MTKMGTTTFIGRASSQIREAHFFALKAGMASPAILDVGPGASVAFMARRAPKWGPFRTAYLLTESALRKSSLFPLRSFEPSEIMGAFCGLSPESFHILDKEPRVIAAVKKEMNGKFPKMRFEYSTCNIEDFSAKGQFDLVFAYNVIQRTNDWSKSLRAISESVRENGILSISFDNKLSFCGGISKNSVDAFLSGFEKLGEWAYGKKPSNRA
jgi:SAM-dependent methyltransferase